MQHIHMMLEWTEGIRHWNCSDQLIITLDKECRDWCNSVAESEVFQVIEEKVRGKDGSVHHRDSQAVVSLLESY